MLGGVYRETESAKLAVKTVFKDQILDGIRLCKLSCELAILRRLKHENLVELVDEFDSIRFHCSVFPLYVVSQTENPPDKFSGGFRLGPGSTGPPNLAQHPNFNWFYSNFA